MKYPPPFVLQVTKLNQAEAWERTMGYLFSCKRIICCNLLHLASQDAEVICEVEKSLHTHHFVSTRALRTTWYQTSTWFGNNLAYFFPSPWVYILIYIDHQYLYVARVPQLRTHMPSYRYWHVQMDTTRLNAEYVAWCFGCQHCHACSHLTVVCASAMAIEAHW